MTTMIESLAVEDVSQDTAQNEVPEAAQAAQEKASPAKRRKYSGNDVLRLRKTLDEARMDMDKQCLSMNDVVHILQDRLDAEDTQMFLRRSGQDYYHGRLPGYRAHPERLSCQGKKGCNGR